MKKCPQCSRDYTDDTLSFCLDDGTSLLDGPASSDEPATAILPDGVNTEEPRTLTIDPAEAEATKLYQDDPGKASPRKIKVMAGIALILAVASLAIGGYWYFGLDSSDQIDSIAVLPFENPDNNSDTEYLSDGVAESIIYELSKIPELKVSPRSSVFRYKGQGSDLQKVGRELNVDAVLSGRIIQRGDDLIIRADLVDIRNDRTVWGEQYQRKVSDLLKTQREITQAITSNLRLRLSAPSGDTVSGGYTENNEAYRSYLRGEYYYNKRSEEGFRLSIQNYRKAIDLDPGFALAYVGLVKSYFFNSSYGHQPVTEMIPNARAAARKALDLAPDLADAHLAQALLAGTVDWDWDGAEAAYKRALELNPNLAEAHYFYGIDHLRVLRRYDEAIAEIKKALELEPMSVPVSANLARVYFYQGKRDLAMEQIKRSLELDRNHPTALGWYSKFLLFDGKYSEYREFCRDKMGQVPNCLPHLGYALAKEGRRQEVENVLEEMKKEEAAGTLSYTMRALVYIALGETKLALDDLERGADSRHLHILDIVSDPLFDPVREEPRFKAIVEKMNLSQ